MFIKSVKDVKFESVLHKFIPSNMYMLFTPPRGQALFIKKAPSPPPPQSEEAALLTFWDLSHYNGNCRQDTQSIPNS